MSTYLGLDLSTQRLKAVITDDSLQVLFETSVDFDKELPEFGTQGGVIKGDNGVVTSPVAMWVMAVDILLNKMKLNGVDFSNINALSGAAQQHGSVYWKRNSKAKLQNLDPSKSLFEQLKDGFTIKQSPIWMDSSTSLYCKLMEEAVGGSYKMAEITGSRAFERFTGPQIAKIYDQNPEAYNLTERISLISSFVCSLFLGNYAEIDFADASGMNLMDIKTKKWHESCLKALKAPNLADKLGNPTPSCSNFGNISKYFVKRFGFNPNCKVISFTGDNPATLEGIFFSTDDVIISLGTSDTIILSLPEQKVFINGHIMCKATERNEWMGLLCFKNGSLTRERMRDEYSERSWNAFNKCLDCTPRGNDGNVGLYFDNAEIFPHIGKGEYRWNSRGERVMKFDNPDTEIRALVEGQFIAHRFFAEKLGFIRKSKNCKLLATGGASSNKAILQVLSDIFNVPVYVQKYSCSAAIGSAYLAKVASGLTSNFQRDFMAPAAVKLMCTPNSDAEEIYDPLLSKYENYISHLLETKTE